MASKKRKVEEENRQFNADWEEEFVVIEEGKGCVCLLCDSKIATLKRSNINEHFSTKHKEQFNKKYPVSTAVRSAKIAILKTAKSNARKLLQNAFKADRGLLASMKVSWMVAQAQKPYSDVELIKKVASVLVEDLAEGNETKLVTKIKAVPLSADIVTRRVAVCIDDIDKQISQEVSTSYAFALAVDESTDIQDISQCCIFIRFINDFKVTEDLLHLHPLKGQTRGEDVFNDVLETLKKFGIPLEQLYSATTDGAPSMTGKVKGFMTLLKEYCQTRDDIVTYHCIIHQQNLASLHSAAYEDVMKDVVDIVNFIRSHAPRP